MVSAFKYTLNNGGIRCGPCAACGCSDFKFETHRACFLFFFIPSFSLENRDSLTCLECDAVYTKQTLTESQKLCIANSATKPMFPIWHFTGLALLLLWLIPSLVTLPRDIAACNSFVESPQTATLIIFPARDYLFPALNHDLASAPLLESSGVEVITHPSWWLEWVGSAISSKHDFYTLAQIIATDGAIITLQPADLRFDTVQSAKSHSPKWDTIAKLPKTHKVHASRFADMCHSLNPALVERK